MQHDIRKAVVLDSGDLDAILELRASLGHALHNDRIQNEILRNQDELERPAEESRTNYLRGLIAGLRTSLLIPEILELEAKASVENEHAR